MHEPAAASEAIPRPRRMSLLEKPEPARSAPVSDPFESDDDARPAWIAQVTTLVRSLALKQREFTSDEVWSEVHEKLSLPLEPKLIGNALQRAQREGWILKTDRVRRSTRPACHRRPAAIWRSLICRAAPKKSAAKKSTKPKKSTSPRKVR